MKGLSSFLDQKRRRRFSEQGADSSPRVIFASLFLSFSLSLPRPTLHFTSHFRSTQDFEAQGPSYSPLFYPFRFFTVSLPLSPHHSLSRRMLRSSAAPTTPTKRPLTELLATSKRTTEDGIAKKRKLSNSPPQSERLQDKENREIGDCINEISMKVDQTEGFGKRPM